jgi:hypothetical protein
VFGVPGGVQGRGDFDRLHAKLMDDLKQAGTTLIDPP